MLRLKHKEYAPRARDLNKRANKLRMYSIEVDQTLEHITVSGPVDTVREFARGCQDGLQGSSMWTKHEAKAAKQSDDGPEEEAEKAEIWGTLYYRLPTNCVAYTNELGV